MRRPTTGISLSALPATVPAALLAFMLSACGSGSNIDNAASSAPPQSAAAESGAGTDSAAIAYFNANVEPNVQSGNCRVCHVAGGISNQPGYPITNQLTLTSDTAQDYANFLAAWQNLPQPADVTLSDLVMYPSGSNGHPGGQVWPVGGTAYVAMEHMLTTWAADSGSSSSSSSSSSGGSSSSSSSSSSSGGSSSSSSSSSSSGGGISSSSSSSGGGTTSSSSSSSGGSSSSSGGQVSLLGDLTATGGRNWVGQLCMGQPDSTPIDWSQEPRALMTGANIDNPNYAVYFNDPWENCHTDTLFATQAKQNAIRLARGEQAVYTAKRNPATCGEWRTRVLDGFNYINGSHGPSTEGLGIDAYVYDNLWMEWGLKSKPADFDQQVVQRYGFSPSPFRNPYPLPGEDPVQTNGGSGQLPLGFSQTRDPVTLQYTGLIGINCFICHAGRIGSGEVVGTAGEVPTNPTLAAAYGANPAGSFMGYPNNLQDFGLAINELLRSAILGKAGAANIPLLKAIGTPINVNQTRGTHSADLDIWALFMLRDVDTENLIVQNDGKQLAVYILRDIPWLLLSGRDTGEQASPPWWWAHNKARYLWFGGHSSDTVRGDMYFDGTVSQLPGDRIKLKEGYFDDVHLWQDSVEAPTYPYGFCTGANGAPGPNDNPGCIYEPLAEQGAILFHSKNLWDPSLNNPVARPAGGNGSCASCHGAYSPQFANQPGFLPDPRMIGESSYTVPLEIIGTDPSQAEGWTPELRPGISTFWNAYPDAMPGYTLPENKTPAQEALDDIGVFGYTTPQDYVYTFNQIAQELNDPALAKALQPLINLAGNAVGGTIEALAAPFTKDRVKGACSFEEKTIGYTAPPLHGVWAAAPYFHNGSVPNVWQVLKPSDRQPMWARQSVPAGTSGNKIGGFDPSMAAYDTTKLGWKYTEVNCGDTLPDGVNQQPYYTCEPSKPMSPSMQGLIDVLNGGNTLFWEELQVPAVGDSQAEIRKTYNTHLYGHSNSGHQFTQVLTDSERKALIEYLKTL
ncbi:MAG: hypothetical protein P4L83_17135 [Nevskia sp.]|nr:hypothetical protein [Nevskia sp.]